MTEKVKKPSIPLHPMVFSLKGRIDKLEQRLEKLEKPIPVFSSEEIAEINKHGGITLT